MFYWLATESEAAGFGLNLDIFETNLINLSVVIGVLVYFVGGVLKKILAERRTAIEAEIVAAEKRQADAQAMLAAEEQKLAQSKVEAERILASAKASAEASKAEILAAAEREIERLKQSATQDTTTSQERAIAELRRQTAKMALEKVEATLDQRLSNNQAAQEALFERSVALLGGN
ncbi:F0F1 ATP synthase subunit B [Lyngbya confervoides]|uniref:ATP synthase subunit b n=1 Tax=Lyngbya confervoides BDU141951 TaxID=1574623 RepID=A0ABD4T5T6_9CYAN|nr:F0F1 ATP synthase subunit B [Lyngbya confervoides]MCM1984077.1 F0F1 ATP synthase subunit B [Lyngbya confervoides BDU141951]